jgi:hypothetical protein
VSYAKRREREMTEHEFNTEYRTSSRHTAYNKFRDIIAQHAIIMIDATEKSTLDKHDCIRLGARLGKVQDHWIDLLCVGADTAGLEKEYRRVVTRIIRVFTNHLMDVLIDDCFVSYEQLASIGDFHSHLTAASEANLKRTRILFEQYALCLCMLYKHGPGESRFRTGLHALYMANALGMWLDATIFQ